MLDNPDEHGIYPTAGCFEKLDKLYDELCGEEQNPAKDIIMDFLRESNWLNLEDEKNASGCVDIYLKHYSEQKEEHNTCDGCQMFADCGCMLDDSCPECVEHHLWTSRKEYTKCPTCNGTGVNHYDDNNNCGTCHGEGTIEEQSSHRTAEERFTEIKFKIAEIQFSWLDLTEDKHYIEANPSTHRIALYVVDLLKEASQSVNLREELIKFYDWIYKNQSKPQSRIKLSNKIDSYLSTHEPTCQVTDRDTEHAITGG